MAEPAFGALSATSAVGGQCAVGLLPKRGERAADPRGAIPAFARFAVIEERANGRTAVGPGRPGDRLRCFNIVLTGRSSRRLPGSHGGISTFSCTRARFEVPRSLSSSPISGVTSKKKLLVIWDGSKPHRSPLVRDFLDQQNGTIAVERLPAYASELNPVEYIWGYWKHHELPNFCPKTFTEPSYHAIKALKRMRRRPTLITAFWHQAELF
jgi:transposase